MPILGLLLGHSLAHVLGGAARWIGAGLLIATGAYAVLQAIRGQAQDVHRRPLERTGRGPGGCWSPGSR